MMRNNVHAVRSSLSRRLMLRCAAAMTICMFTVIFLIFFAWVMCRTKYWYDYEITYRILYWVQDHIVIIAGTLIAGGWLLIFIYYVRKSLGFLDEIISESEKLAMLEREQINLSPELIDVQDKLNMLREKAKNSAAAAKDAEQRKNDLIVYLAHDLKTPLTSIIGYLALMYDEPDISAESRAKYTGIALEKAQRLEELINEFFDITRFNLTHISLETENINFTRLIEQTAFEFEPILAKKGLSWELSVAENIQLKCDPDKIERVIDNIIKNAVSYSYPDTTIKLKLIKSEDSVILSVENKGRTISQEKLVRIFEQFFRIDSSRGTKTGGAGLGLAIAKEITELHGGTISAESKDERIRFTVCLPL